MGTFNPAELDNAQRERVDEFVRSFRSSPSVSYEGLFSSERVAKSIQNEKFVINGFDPEKLLGVLPFTPAVYSPICSICVKRKHYPQFKTLVKSGLVVPILVGGLKYFDEELREFIAAHDYVSHWELSAYQFLRTNSAGDDTLCASCLRKSADGLLKKVSRRKNFGEYKETLHRFLEHLAPFPTSDSELIERGFEYCAAGKLDLLEKLSAMTYVIQQIRTGETLNSPVLLADSDLARLPANISVAGNETRAQAAKISKMVADGLGISIPTDIKLETYVELVRDYQPRISKTIRTVLDSEGSQASVADASKSIASINSEIERIKNLRRYTVLEAGISFYKNNSTLVNGTLLAGALGLTGSLAGCLATGGATIATKVAKSKGWLKESEATARLRRVVARDLQPALDLVLKSYLGTRAPAINVLSLQKKIIAARQDSVLEKAE